MISWRAGQIALLGMGVVCSLAGLGALFVQDEASCGVALGFSSLFYVGAYLREKARRQRLEGALRPFAEAADNYWEAAYWKDVGLGLRVEHLKRAKDALLG